MTQAQQTSTVFSVGKAMVSVNENAVMVIIAYCFANVPGYQRIGKRTPAMAAAQAL